MQGKIIKGIAGFYYVYAEETDTIYECKAKGIFRNRKVKPLVGDLVAIEVLDEEQAKGNITEILPRKNELIRPASANVDQAMVIFAAANPEPNFHLLDRFLVMMDYQNVPTVICFNKEDLIGADEKERLREIYAGADCQIVFTSTRLLSTHGQGFIEGNAWNYSFYVPQAPSDLIRLMGGNRSFINKLDSLFTMHLPDEFFAQTEDVTREGLLGTYVHGNEPSHHIPYLYSWTTEPWKTQYWIREIMNRMYRNNIDGLCGNDDCGQMSAWYIFSAMGFYPVCPGTDQYVIGAPYLPYMQVNLENGKTFTVRADKVSDKNRYIKSVTLNGQPYKKAYITHQDIMNGGELVFQMTSSPNKRRQFTAEEKPYSLVE